MKKQKRLLSVLLSVALLFGSVDTAIFAQEPTEEKAQTWQTENETTEETKETKTGTLTESEESSLAKEEADSTVELSAEETETVVENVFEETSEYTLESGSEEVSEHTVSEEASEEDTTAENPAADSDVQTLDYLQYVVVDDSYVKITGLNNTEDVNYTETITAISIPEAIEGYPVKSIGERAFSNCTALSKVTFAGDSVQTICEWAFSGCTNLTDIQLPSSLTNITYGVFSNCTSLKTITIPASVTSASGNSSTFKGCTGLTTVVFEDGTAENPRVIPSYICSNAPALETVEIPKYTKSINDSAFSNCTALSKVTFADDSVKEIKANAFNRCTNLKNLSFANNSGNDKFFVLPKNLTSIGRGAFYACSSMNKNIYIQNTDIYLADENTFKLYQEGGAHSVTIHALKGSTGETYANRYDYYDYKEWDGVTFDDKFQNLTAQIPNDEFWIVLQDVGGNAITKGMFESANGWVEAKEVVKWGFDEKLDCALEDIEGLGVIKVKNMEPNKDGFGVIKNIRVAAKMPGWLIPNSVTQDFEASGGHWGTMTIDKFQNPCVAAVNVTDSRGKNINMLYRSATFYKSGKKQYPLEVTINYANVDDQPDRYSFQLLMLDEAYHETVLDTFNGRDSICLDLEKLPKNVTDPNLFLQVFLDGSKLCTVKIRVVVLEEMPEIPDEQKITVGSELVVPVPEIVPIFGGGEFDFDLKTDIPVEIDFSSDGTKLQIVGSLGEWSNEEDDLNLSNFKQKAKEAFFKNYNPSDLDFGHTEIAGMDVSVQFAVYLEGFMKPNSTSIPMDLRIVGEFKVENSVTYSTVIGPVPVYVSVGGEIKDEANASLSDFEITLDKDFKITAPASAEFENTLDLAVKPKAGVGVNGAASVYVEGNGTFEWKTELSNKLSWANTVLLKLGLSMGAEVLCFKYEKTLAETEFQLYPVKSSKARTADIPFETAMYDASNYSVMQRDYVLEEDTAAMAYANASRASDSNVLINGMYPDARPKYIPYNGADYLFYLEDQTERAVEDKSTLVYRVNTGTGWSSAKAVNDDGTADFAYDVVAGSDGIYIVWQNASKSLSGVSSIPAVMENIALSAAKLSDGNISLLDTPKNEEGLAPVMVSLAADDNKVWIYWFANTENDLLNNSNGNNIIYRTEAGSTQIQKLAETDHGITTLASGILNGEPCAAVTADTDGKQNTVDDREIYLIKDDGMTALTDNEVMDSNPQFGRIGQEQVLIYYSENNFMRSNGTTVVPIFDKEYKNLSSDNFRLVCDGSNAVIVWPETYATAEKMGYSLAMTAYKDGKWTAPANAAQLDNTLVDFTVKTYDGGKAKLYYTELDESGVSAITRLYEAEARQIGRAVFSGVLYDAENYVPGNALPMTVGIYNDGTCEISDCNVTIEDGKGNTVYTRNQISAPSAGKATELEITDFVPENQTYENYRIQLICDGNVCDIRDLEIGGAEYTITYSTKYEAVTEYDGADEERLYVMISNDSNFKGDVKLVITGGESGEVLYENTYEGLEPGNSANYMSSLTQLWKQTSDRYIILTAQSLDREEPYLMDNSVSVFNYERMDAKVKVNLDRSEAELAVGETLQLTADVQAKEGADTTLRWESRDSEYATVDQNGLVTAITPGLTLITVWTADGGRSTCYVKVLPKEGVQSEHTITYYDGTQQIVLEPSVFKENEEVLLLVPYKEGYDFAGWYETPDFSGSAVERIPKGTATDKVLYAKWTKRIRSGHLITYYDGTQQIMLEPSIFGEDEAALLPEPYKAGYDFAGWYETPDFSGSVIEWIPEGTTTDKVFYAKWAERVREKNDAKTETSLSVEFAGTGIYTYTGAAIKPEVIVRDEGQILQQGRDYTVSYKNNTQAATAVSEMAQQGIAPYVDSDKAPMVLITGKGNYKGKKAAAMNFTIKARELSDASIVLTCDDSMASKSAKGSYADQQLAAALKDGKKSLNKAKDYIITYDYLGEDGSRTPTGADKDMTAVNKPGAYTVHISARIVKDSSGRMIRSSAKNNMSNANYTGSLEPFTLYVQDSAKILSKAKITLANTKGIQQGTANITVEQVIRSITFGNGKNAEVYETDTVEKKAAFTEKFDVAGLDTLTMKAGTGYITVTAKAGSGYFGSKRVAVKILGTPLSKAVFTQTGNSTAFTYNGTVQAPVYTLQTSGTSPATLTEGKDYTITYQKEKTTVLSPVAVGSYTATYTGIGAYTGTVKKTFKITPLDLASAYKADKNAITVTASAAPYNPKGAVPAEVTVAYTPAGGTALTLAAEDYTIICSQNKAIGKGSITLNAKGNYKGTIKNIMTYDIVAKSMASDDITVEVEDVFYKAGADIAPKLTVYDNGVKVNAKDYTAAFADGSAKLTNYQLPEGAEYADIDLTVTANAGKNYTEGTKASAKLHIYTKKISSVEVILEPNGADNQYYYTGQQIKPAPQSVTYKESKNAQEVALANSETEGYLVRYGANTKPGSGTMTIYGTGKYGGSKTVKFMIYPKWMKWMFG